MAIKKTIYDPGLPFTLTRLADGFGPGIALLENPDSPLKMGPPLSGKFEDSAI